MTARTVMSSYPHTARKLVALLAALATLLALFGGLSLAPKPAHAATYTMTFDPNGGTTPAGSVTSVTSDASGRVSPTQLSGVTTPTRAADYSGRTYTFTGWYSAATGGGRLDMHTYRRLTSNETWYAHWAQYSVTFDAGSGNYFSPNHVTRETDLAADRSRDTQTWTIYPDSSGRITAQQIQKIPDAFKVSGSGASASVSIATLWKTVSDFTLPADGFTVTGDVTFHAASWESASSLTLVSTNNISAAGELTNGGTTNPSSTDTITYDADSWSGVPGIVGNNVTLEYHASCLYSSCESGTSYYKAIFPNIEVKLYGLPGERIKIEPYYDFIYHRGYTAFSYFNENAIGTAESGGIFDHDFAFFDGLWWGNRKAGAFYTTFLFPLESSGSQNINLFPALASTASKLQDKVWSNAFFRICIDLPGSGVPPCGGDYADNYPADVGFHPGGTPDTALKSPYTMPDATSLWGSRETPGKCQNNFPIARPGGVDTRKEISCATPLNLDQMDVRDDDTGRHFIGWARKQQSSQTTWTGEDLQSAGLTIPPYLPKVDPDNNGADVARTSFLAGLNNYLSDNDAYEAQFHISYYGWWGYKATLDPNGGSFSDHSTVKYVYTDADGKLTVSAMNAAPKPTRTGYAFLGWNTKADGSGTDFPTDSTASPVTLGKDTTYYAHWKRNPTMTFDAAGGSLNGLSKMQLISERNSSSGDWVVSAAQLATVPVPTLRDTAQVSEKFEGWYLENSDGTVSDTKLGHVGKKVLVISSL